MCRFLLVFKKGFFVSSHRAPAEKPASASRVGLLGLIAISVSAMVGGGIYSLPATLAGLACPAATLLAWLVTGVGMGFVVTTFRILAQVRPDLTNGIFSYADTGFGKLVAFLVALGYWCTSCCAMATYGVLIMATFSPLVPALGAGNTPLACLGASVVVWAIYALARRGVETAASINLIGTIAKFVPIVIFVAVCLANFDWAQFQDSFYNASATSASGGTFDGLIPQALSALMTTLWVFIGIEGAVVVSGDAVSQKAVGRAVGIAFGVALTFYILVSLVPYGSFSQSQVAAMSSPSTAAILQGLVGPWGRVLISAGIVIAILSSWLVWMCLQGQMPTSAAEYGIFPAFFKERNSYGAPGHSLLWSAAVTQLFLIFACVLGPDAWDTLVSITSVMTMPAYFFCCAFLVTQAVGYEGWPTQVVSRSRGLVIGIAGSIFGAILVCAAGLENLMLACIVFALGLPLFFFGLKANGQLGTLKRYEKVIICLLLCCALAALCLFTLRATGSLSA